MQSCIAFFTKHNELDIHPYFGYIKVCFFFTYKRVPLYAYVCLPHAVYLPFDRHFVFFPQIVTITNKAIFENYFSIFTVFLFLQQVLQLGSLKILSLLNDFCIPWANLSPCLVLVCVDFCFCQDNVQVQKNSDGIRLTTYWSIFSFDFNQVS